MKTDKIIEILKEEFKGIVSMGIIDDFDLEKIAAHIDSLYPTLNRDKIYRLVNKFYPNWPDKLVKELCSLSLPSLSEEEIEKEADLISAKNIHRKEGFRMGVNWVLSQLTKPKEE